MNTPTQAAKNDFIIVPGERVGLITNNTSEKELVKLLGPAVVMVGDTLYGAEGETFIGTTLYKGTADEVQVFYGEGNRIHPSTVKVVPQYLDQEGNPIPNQAPSHWATNSGVRIGTMLKELEQRNGKPFKLWGFEWDYGGQISDWQGGKMASVNEKTFLAIALGSPLNRTAVQEKAYNNVTGDGEFVSSNPAMQQLNPIVIRLETELH